jgi:hypothetical protein
MPQPAMDRTFDRFHHEHLRRLVPGAEYVFTPYEVRIAAAFVRVGQRDRAWLLLDFLMASRRPAGWQHLAEVVHHNPRFPCYFGDMPHTWVGAELVICIRTLFVFEDGGRLVIGAGLKEEWLDGSGVCVRDMPTWYGAVSYAVRRENGKVFMSLSGPCAPPAGFHIRLPPSVVASGEIIINGSPITVDGSEIVWNAQKSDVALIH